MTSDGAAEVVRRLLDALARRDEDAVRAELHRDVVAVGHRGPKRGADDVVAWAKPTDDGHLRSSVEIDEIREIGGEWVGVAARRLWRWHESGDLADEEPFGVLFHIANGKVVSWDQTYASVADALNAIPAT